ncbi:MAG: PepSY domain-containing protein [Enterococcus aquimarinus]|uniref:PepSY domain-containing protein n=1 Tax=Enterococcus aquimarinus TaxID=328396 RepID=A0A9E3ZWL8_9ENTE|nr:PepSY domain-containing protein [Enterococcus aquimarinus]
MKKKTWITIGLMSLSAAVLVGCTTTTDNTTNQSSTTITSTITSEGNTSLDSTENAMTTMSWQDAVAVFQEKFPETSITSISFDTSFGKWYYDIEGINDTTEFELRIDPATGETSREEQQTLDKDEQNAAYRESEALDLEGVISIEEASQIALDAVGSGEVTDLDLERELSVTYWKVTIEDGRKEFEVSIDARTKEVLTTERDD